MSFRSRRKKDMFLINNVVREVTSFSSLRSSDVQQLTQSFRKYNKSGTLTGCLTTKEFDECLGVLRLSKDVIARIHTAFDHDNNGLIDYHEFIMGLAIFLGGDRDKKVEMLFQLFDNDGSRYLDREEIAHFLRSLLGFCDANITEDKIQAKISTIIRALDENNDGQISLSEFKRQFTRSPLLVQAFDMIFYSSAYDKVIDHHPTSTGTGTSRR